MNIKVSRLFDLSGKVALVIGASRGIGAAIAEGLSDAGARVFAIGRTAQPAKDFSAAVEYSTGDIRTDSLQLILRAASAKGRLDCLVNCAGVSISNQSQIDEGTRFRQTIETNLFAAFDACMAAATFMGSGGSIINVTSIGSVVGFPGNPGYVSSKGALRLMTKALAVDLGSKGIRVNSLAPGYIHTSMTSGSHDSPPEYERRKAHTCLGRWGEPEDLIGAAVFLASDASAYVTGTDIFVDGGWTAKGLV